MEEEATVERPRDLALFREMVIGRVVPLDRPVVRMRLADARLCVNCDDLFDGRAARGRCACGSEQSVSLARPERRPGVSD